VFVSCDRVSFLYAARCGLPEFLYHRNCFCSAAFGSIRAGTEIVLLTVRSTIYVSNVFRQFSTMHIDPKFSPDQSTTCTPYGLHTGCFYKNAK